MVQTIDFLGIGVQKAATSWLWKNLQRHPDIWLPPLKELHYFSRDPRYPSSSHLFSKYLVQRAFGFEEHNRVLRKMAREEIGSAIRQKDWSKTRWLFRYYFGTYDDNWYCDLFAAGADQIKGEITPAYSLLDWEDVRRVHNLFPDLKILLILRDPIERAWSHARYAWTRGYFESIDDIDQVKKFIDSPDQVQRSDYIRILDAWGACFSGDALYIGFYDQIVHEPQEIVLDVLKMLGADIASFQRSTVMTNKTNISKELNIPGEIAEYLALKYRADLQELSKLFGGYASTWLANAEDILAKGRQSST